MCSSKQAIEDLGRTCTDTERIQMNDWRASPTAGVNKSRSSALLALVLAVFPLLCAAVLLQQQQLATALLEAAPHAWHPKLDGKSRLWPLWKYPCLEAHPGIPGHLRGNRARGPGPGLALMRGERARDYIFHGRLRRSTAKVGFS